MSEKNRSEAAIHYKKACDLGFHMSCQNLGNFHIEDKNFSEALPFHIKACELKNYESCNEVGWLKRYRLNDIPGARPYYKLACEGKSVFGCYNYGIFLVEEKNQPEANKLFEYSCSKGNKPSCFELGLAYLDEKKYDLALPHFMATCSKDIIDSCYNVACIHSLSKRVDMSLKFLEKTFQFGYSDWAHLDQDTDLTNIRGDKRFVALVKKYRK